MARKKSKKEKKDKSEKREKKVKGGVKQTVTQTVIVKVGDRKRKSSGRRKPKQEVREVELPRQMPIIAYQTGYGTFPLIQGSPIMPPKESQSSIPEPFAYKPTEEIVKPVMEDVGVGRYGFADIPSPPGTEEVFRKTKPSLPVFIDEEIRQPIKPGTVKQEDVFRPEFKPKRLPTQPQIIPDEGMIPSIMDMSVIPISRPELLREDRPIKPSEPFFPRAFMESNLTEPLISEKMQIPRDIFSGVTIRGQQERPTIPIETEQSQMNIPQMPQIPSSVSIVMEDVGEEEAFPRLRRTPSVPKKKGSVVGIIEQLDKIAEKQSLEGFRDFFENVVREAPESEPRTIIEPQASTIVAVRPIEDLISEATSQETESGPMLRLPLAPNETPIQNIAYVEEGGEMSPTSSITMSRNVDKRSKEGLVNVYTKLFGEAPPASLKTRQNIIDKITEKRSQLKSQHSVLFPGKKPPKGILDLYDKVSNALRNRERLGIQSISSFGLGPQEVFPEQNFGQGYQSSVGFV